MISFDDMTPRLLNVTNGDCAAETLRQASEDSKVIVYADVYHEGPLPADADDETLRDLRGRYFEQKGWASHEGYVARGLEQDADLARFVEHDEVVLWFEHDLYDQLLLIRHLDWFARQDMGEVWLSMVCIDAFPGVTPFHGLGQLNAQQMASLVGSQQTLLDDQIALGQRAWMAFRASTPEPLVELMKQDRLPLPFLAPALRRFLQEYPWTDNGLSRTQRQIVQALHEGANTPSALFTKCCIEMEEAPFMGDTTFFAHLDDLATCDKPLLEYGAGTMRDTPVDKRDGYREQQVALTPTGEAVRSGATDHVALNGLDRWLGGVYLGPNQPVWRWDQDAGGITS